MTVLELIKCLRESQDEEAGCPVVATWEGIFRSLNRENVHKSPNGFIVIDADMNHYKERIISGQKKVHEADNLPWVDSDEELDGEQDEADSGLDRD